MSVEQEDDGIVEDFSEKELFENGNSEQSVQPPPTKEQKLWKIIAFNLYPIGNQMAGWFSNSIFFPIQVCKPIMELKKGY